MTPSPELLSLIAMASALLGLCLLAGWEWVKRIRANNRLTDAMLRRGFRRANNNGWVKP